MLKTYVQRILRPLGVSISIAAFAFAVTVPTQSFAKWPDRPITVVVAYKAGGGGDKSSRIIAKAMGKELGVKINVVNKSGAVDREE